MLEIRENFCGCDGSSGDEDTRTLIVRAAPGEVNRMSARQLPRGCWWTTRARRVFSRAVRFGALQPGERRVITIRLTGPLPRHCVRARVTTRRDDIPATTELRFAVHCVLP